MNTSASRARSLTRARPRGSLRLTVIDFLLALNNRKYQESLPGSPRSDPRPGSPPLGFSTFTTSAPSQPSASVQDGPASNCVKSRTRTPARQAWPFAPIAVLLDCFAALLVLLCAATTCGP